MSKSENTTKKLLLPNVLQLLKRVYFNFRIRCVHFSDNQIKKHKPEQEDEHNFGNDPNRCVRYGVWVILCVHRVVL